MRIILALLLPLATLAQPSPPTSISLAPATILWESSPVYVSRDASNIQLQVRRLGNNAGPLTVFVNTTDGTAVAGKDYTDVNQIIQWTDGDQGTKVVNVPINAPAIQSKTTNPTLYATISVQSGFAVLGEPHIASLVLNMDNRMQVNNNPSSSSANGGSNAGGAGGGAGGSTTDAVDSSSSTKSELALGLGIGLGLPLGLLFLAGLLFVAFRLGRSQRQQPPAPNPQIVVIPPEQQLAVKESLEESPEMAESAALMASKMTASSEPSPPKPNPIAAWISPDDPSPTSVEESEQQVASATESHDSI